MIPQRHYTYCAICLKPLTEEEKKTTGKDEINSTCTAHNAYKNARNLASVRMNLGLSQDEKVLAQLHKK